MTLIIILFTIGILLLAAEVLVPGAILGLAGGVLLFTGCVLSFVQLGLTEGIIAIACTIVAALIVFYIQFKILPKTPFGKRFFLNEEVDGTSSALSNDARELIGKTAKSVTVLSPSGYILIDGKRYEATSQSGQIPAGTDLLVTEANHFQLTVRTQ
ncbi:NfeD family protein [Luteolibacter sp. AS25]|uniref:NfeD family protein n=1 Tax=Luteolibacter sp. AS25 TaxID=3135776 RepID=UPI00398AF0A4